MKILVCPSDPSNPSNVDDGSGYASNFNQAARVADWTATTDNWAVTACTYAGNKAAHQAPPACTQKPGAALQALLPGTRSAD